MFSIKIDSEDGPSRKSWQKKGKKREYISIYFRGKLFLPTLRRIFWVTVLAFLITLAIVKVVK